MSEEATTADTLLGGRVALTQPAQGYRVAIDPVLLAAAVPAQAGEMILDVGAGVGAAALCLARRIAGCRVVGLEFQPALAALANANAARNLLHDRVATLAGDILRPPVELVPGSFDHIMANPPHQDAARTMASPVAAKAAANVEGLAKLADWIGFCLAMVRAEGGITVIHRADRIDEVLAAFHGKAGGIVVFPLWPMGDGRPAKRAIVQAYKGVATPTRFAAGLVLHRPDGRYTAEAEAILREGAPLAL